MFLAGRWTSPAHTVPPEPVEGASPVAAEPQVPTSTCACPAPKKPRARPRAPSPRRIAAAPAVDRTGATATFLKQRARSLSSCAPLTGAPLSLHLEIEVSPDGVVRRVQLRNLEPVPTTVADCVDTAISGWRPPGFDGVDPERFALTVVL